MTCREFADFVMDYFEGQLAADARARFDRHLTRAPIASIISSSTATRCKPGRRRSTTICQPPLPDDLVQAILEARKDA